MAKKRKLRKEATSDLGILLGVCLVIVSFGVSREDPLSVILWLGLMAALLIRCAMKSTHDRIMGFPGFCAMWGGMIPIGAMRECRVVKPLALWAIPLTALVMALLCLSLWRKERKEKAWVKALLSLALGMMVFVCALNATALINAAFDGSTPRQMTATVADRYETSGSKGSTTKHVVVAVPGEESAVKFTVGRARYRAVSIGDEVTVLYREGFLGLPWWEMEPVQ